MELSVEAQIAKLQHGDPGERYYAAWWLGFPGAKAALPALITALSSDPDTTPAGGYPVRRNAAQALGKIGDPQAVPALLAALQQSDPLVVAKVAKALGEIHSHHPHLGEQLLPPLLEWLSRDPPLQPTDAVEAVLETLGNLGSPLALAAIRPYVEHGHPRLVHAACRALYRLTGEGQYVERLLAGLGHPNLHIRRGALFDLAATGAIEVAPAIAQAPLETNLKLVALKTLGETYLRQFPQATVELKPLLACLDALL
ncbi:MAG: HEAT repeat domain-containing protein [Thermostichales cyanobacterium SZTDM-1c_bins_54]